MKRILLLTTVFMMMLGTSFSSAQTDADNFYKSDLVSVEKVSFSNQYKMKVAGNLFLPKNMKEGDKYPAIIVGHPMGAVKGTGLGLPIVKIPFTFCVDISLSAKPQVVLTENGHRKRTVDFLAWEIGRFPIPFCVPGA